jgi:DHA1 family bicyclomycin/chloramphenicol resistance-like MFS transporter
MRNTPAVRDATLSPLLLLIFMASFASLQPLATDLFQSALPAIGAAFEAPVARVQLTLTVFIAAFGPWQLVAGPLSDRFGRYPVALAGVFTYAAASALCTFAPSMAWLIFGRALQALGACSCLVAARAMVRDRLAPAEGARLLAASGTILGVFALSAPIIGGLMLAASGWRATFGTMFALSTALALAAVWRLKETLRAPNPRALRLGPLLRSYADVVRSPTWHAYTWPAVFSYAGLFSFISGGSFVLIKVLGVSPVSYGFCFSFVIAGYVAGTLICRRNVARHGLPWTMRSGALVQLAAGLTLAVLALAEVHHPLALLLPQFVFMVSHGLIQPVSQAGSVARFAHSAGVATAALGLAMMLIAAAVGQWIGASFNGTVYPLALTICACSIATAISVWALVRKHGHVD